MRAERRLGEMLRKQEETEGLNRGTRLGGSVVAPQDERRHARTPA
jgi:hypothetical protein